MRGARALVLLALLVPGCAHPSSPAEEPSGRIHTLALDGRWAFDADLARAIVMDAGGIGAADIGAATRAEMLLSHDERRVAVATLALDGRAAKLLMVADLPAPGEIFLTRNASLVLGAKVGDTVGIDADSWPESRIARWFEMEFVAGCEGAKPSNPCVLPLGSNGDVRLRFEVAPRTVGLAFHADVNELGPNDYPAFWNGTFTSPAGRSTRFATAVFSPVDIRPPGFVGDGSELESGPWRIQFSLEANGSRRTNVGTLTDLSAGGLIETRAPGYDSYDYTIYDIPSSADQTLALLANATTRSHRLRVAAIVEGVGGLDAGALVASEDAAILTGARGDEATMLLMRESRDPVALARAIAGATDVRVRELHERTARVARLAAPSTGPLVLRAPAALDVAALPPVAGLGEPAFTVETARLVGANDSVGELSFSPRVFALPIGALPGNLVGGGAWPDEDAAREGMRRSPNLALISDDLARTAGLDPANLTYSPLVLDGALGPQRYNVMGALTAGPPETAWIAASLASAMAAPMGARLIVPIEPDVTRDEALARALAAWGPLGIAPLLDG